MQSPMPPQEAQSAEAPQGSGPSEVINQVYSGLMKLAQAAGSAQGAPQGVAEKLAQMAEEFKEIISGGTEPDEAPPAPSNAPMEAGANPNAKPAL